MLNRLRRLWHGDVPGGKDSMPSLRERVPLEMAWLADTQMPIPDWERIAATEPADDPTDRHAFWNSAAAEWLEALGQQLGEEHRLRHSPNFFLLSALPDRQAELFLVFCERVLRHVRGNLKALADDGGFGRFVAIVFAHEDDYYDYISHYYPEGGEYSM